MSTQQELIEQNIRVLLGDLQLQLVFAKAQISVLEEQVADVMAKQKVAETEAELQSKVPPAVSKTNGARAAAPAGE